jgi:cytidine deaminase
MAIKADHYIEQLAHKRLCSGCPGIFYHCAIIFTKKRGVICPLSYGENQIRGKSSIHAEVNAIEKLPSRKDGRLLKVSLLVFRVTKSGKYTMSKPCMHCIEKMNQTCARNYKIFSVYYTNKDGDFEKSSLNQLSNEPEKHVSKWYRENVRSFRTF